MLEAFGKLLETVPHIFREAYGCAGSGIYYGVIGLPCQFLQARLQVGELRLYRFPLIARFHSCQVCLYAQLVPLSLEVCESLMETLNEFVGIHICLLVFRNPRYPIRRTSDRSFDPWWS